MALPRDTDRKNRRAGAGSNSAAGAAVFVFQLCGRRASFYRRYFSQRLAMVTQSGVLQAEA